jgi:hypothetical protein
MDVLLALDDVNRFACLDGLEHVRKPIDHSARTPEPPFAARKPLREALRVEADDLEKRHSALVGVAVDLDLYSPIATFLIREQVSEVEPIRDEHRAHFAARMTAQKDATIAALGHVK